MQDHVGVHLQTVEKAIKALGLDPLKARKEIGHWIIYAKGTPIWLYLTYNKIAKGYFFQVSGPVIHVPNQNCGSFYEQLITLNGEMIGAAFMQKKGTIYVSTNREVKNLDVSEAYAMISRIGNYSCHFMESSKRSLLNWKPYKTISENQIKPDINQFSNN